MPKYIRPKVPGASVFFTVALADRKSNLLVREIDVLRSAVRATRADLPFYIDAWVVLPDHLHCIWTLPEGDADFWVRWKEIKTHFTKAVGQFGPRSVSKVSKGESGIWQRRFWDHHIRDERDFATHLRYCWWNPVKHGLVDRPVDWPHSSIHRDIRLGQVEPEWAGIKIDGAFGE
jgi:putative transposase